MPPKHNFELLFKDSPEYFIVKNARMIFEGPAVRFIIFDKDVWVRDEYYPVANIHRIKVTPAA